MRKAKVLYKNMGAGILTQQDDGSFTFKYNDVWISDSTKPAISLTLPKQEQSYQSKFLFPFFYNMLPEGSNKRVVCNRQRIDANDYFTLLITVAKYDAIGAISLVKID